MEYYTQLGGGRGGGLGLMFENKWRESQTMRNGSHRFTIYAFKLKTFKIQVVLCLIVESN